jgi:hypothetical protein
MVENTDLEIDLDAIEKELAEKNEAEEVAKGKKDETPAPEKKVVEPDEGLEKLKKQLAEEKRARADAEDARRHAETRASEATKSEVEARNESQDNRLALINNAINAVKSSNEALKARYKSAREAGDSDAEFDVQTAISENAAKLVQLEAGKVALEKTPKIKVDQQDEDIVDRFSKQLSPESASWVRKHPEYVRDPQKNKAMIKAHNIAILVKDIKPDSQEYFRFIEDSLGIGEVLTNGKDHHEEVDLADPTQDAAQEVEKPRPPPAAPVTRSGGGSGSNPNRVKLSADEIEMAKLNGQTPAEYAREREALIKEGKISRKPN